ncbi:MAG: hypothetical protein ABR974_09885 [Bacteroidales bacterium]|jgi:hypothetical protein
METYREDPIDSFIRQNRDEFDGYSPPEDHTEKFLTKLSQRISHFINIVPYLVKVAVATLLIFSASILIWNNFIRKDRHEITLRNKISLVIKEIKSIRL